MMQDSLNLDLATKAFEFRVFGQAGTIILEPYRVVDAAILAFVIFLCRMVDFDAAFFDIKVAEDEPRAVEPVNIGVGVENYPRPGEVTAQNFNVV